MRNWGVLVFFSLTWWVNVARAQSATSIDIQALPLPLSAEAASVFESARELEDGGFRWSLRTSGLRKPLALRLPSPAPEGTSAGLVDGLVLSELSASVGLGKGWDAGFGFGVHLRQSTIDDGAGEEAHRVDSFRGRDPRIGIGWASTMGRWSIRPFVQIHLPLGDTKGYAGEPFPRSTLGVTKIFDARFLTISSQLALVYRKPQNISATTWGPQLFLGVGASVPLYRELELGFQFVAQPVLAHQEGPSGAKGGRLVPSEILGSVRYEYQHFRWGLGAGVGLPLSRTSSVHVQQQSVLGPTTPTYRGFLDFVYEN